MLANVDAIPEMLRNLPEMKAGELEPTQRSYELAGDLRLYDFLQQIVQWDPYDAAWMTSQQFPFEMLPHLRAVTTALGLRWGQFVGHLSSLKQLNGCHDSADWREFAKQVQTSALAAVRTADFLRQGARATEYSALETELVTEHPHAVYATSPYRRGSGSTVSNQDFTAVEATMTSTIHTSIRVVENALHPDSDLLADQYRPLGRCVCVIDDKVEQHFGWHLERYFASHEIELEKLVYRAMEADKGTPTVERMLGDFKHLGVSRNEPVLVIGGGVLTDTAGLACALYHRGTPYIMLSTSVVAGIDAGPSPRTCCDGFGYKNLFGAYHPPVLAITDRTFFKTLRPGWIRHGIAEIIKMAVVKDRQLFELLEHTGSDLIATRFGTLKHASAETKITSTNILGRAIKSYVEAEYGNLYETHQCRPHAYGHTWSPGFEIPAGLLHGHAVSIGMGFGAFASEKLGWIDRSDRDRILRLMEAFGLSLYHRQLNDHEMIWEAQRKMTEKRGGHLAAPLPQDAIGNCGYLRGLSQRELSRLLADYAALCCKRERAGLGIEPHCTDVGLENPATTGDSLAATTEG